MVPIVTGPGVSDESWNVHIPERRVDLRRAVGVRSAGVAAAAPLRRRRKRVLDARRGAGRTTGAAARREQAVARLLGTEPPAAPHRSVPGARGRMRSPIGG